MGRHSANKEVDSKSLGTWVGQDQTHMYYCTSENFVDGKWNGKEHGWELVKHDGKECVSLAQDYA